MKKMDPALKIACALCAICFVACMAMEWPIGALAHAIATTVFLATAVLGIAAACYALERDEVEKARAWMRDHPIRFLRGSRPRL